MSKEVEFKKKISDLLQSVVALDKFHDENKSYIEEVNNGGFNILLLGTKMLSFLHQLMYENIILQNKLDEKEKGKKFTLN